MSVSWVARVGDRACRGRPTRNDEASAPLGGLGNTLVRTCSSRAGWNTHAANGAGLRASSRAFCEATRPSKSFGRAPPPPFLGLRARSSELSRADSCAYLQHRSALAIAPARAPPMCRSHTAKRQTHTSPPATADQGWSEFDRCRARLWPDFGLARRPNLGHPVWRDDVRVGTPLGRHSATLRRSESRRTRLSTQSSSRSRPSPYRQTIRDVAFPSNRPATPHRFGVFTALFDARARCSSTPEQGAECPWRSATKMPLSRAWIVAAWGV